MPEAIHPLQLEDFRRMTPAQKLRMAHPQWSEERLEREARRALLYAGT
jgi:hypothetical protein